MSDETCCGACGYPVHATKEMACDWCRRAADRIEALTEQLAAARQDAKAAEDELEMQEQEACMMENDYLKLEKEQDALEAKLAAAEAEAEKYKHAFAAQSRKLQAVLHIEGVKATLAEIKGESQ